MLNILLLLSVAHVAGATGTLDRKYLPVPAPEYREGIPPGVKNGEILTAVGFGSVGAGSVMLLLFEERTEQQAAVFGLPIAPRAFGSPLFGATGCVLLGTGFTEIVIGSLTGGSRLRKQGL